MIDSRHRNENGARSPWAAAEKPPEHAVSAHLQHTGADPANYYNDLHATVVLKEGEGKDQRTLLSLHEAAKLEGAHTRGGLEGAWEQLDIGEKPAAPQHTH